MAKFFPGMYVGDMHFHNRCRHGFDRITYGHRGVSVAPGIEDDAIATITCLLDFVDQLTFHIRLENSEGSSWISSLQTVQIVIKRLVTIGLRFTETQQVQVGTVDDLNLHKSDFDFMDIRYRSRVFTS